MVSEGNQKDFEVPELKLKSLLIMIARGEDIIEPFKDVRNQLPLSSLCGGKVIFLKAIS